MKKLISFIGILLILLACLTACNFTQNASGTFAGQAESTTQAQEMMTALAENRTSDAKALMHPEALEKADAAVNQLCAYLAGRKVSSMNQTNISINKSSGTAGTSKQEAVTYQVTLTDDTVFYISTRYLSDNTGTGFTSFQLVLGLV